MTNKSIRDYINLIENAQREDMAEGAKWRKHPDAYNVDDEGNKTPRNPNSSKFGYDPLQRRADTANDAKTPRGKTAALKTSLKMAKGNKGVAEGFNEQYIYLSPMRGLSEPKFVAKVKGRVTNDILNKLAAKYKVSIEDFEWGDAKWAQQHQGVAEEQLEETTPEAIEKVNQLYRN